MHTKRTKEFFNKFKEKQDSFNEHLKEMRELEAERVKMLEFEQGRIDAMKEKISMLCLIEDMTCGVVISNDDILAILKTLMESGEKDVFIPFNLYHKQEW